MKMINSESRRRSVVPVYLSHVKLIGVRSVVLSIPQLLDLSAHTTDDGLGESVLVELLDVLGEVVLRLLLLPTDGTHAGRGGLALLVLSVGGAVDGSEVRIFTLLGGENLLAVFTFQTWWRFLC